MKSKSLRDLRIQRVLRDSSIHVMTKSYGMISSSYCQKTNTEKNEISDRLTHSVQKPQKLLFFFFRQILWIWTSKIIFLSRSKTFGNFESGFCTPHKNNTNTTFQIVASFCLKMKDIWYCGMLAAVQKPSRQCVNLVSFSHLWTLQLNGSVLLVR